MKIAGMEAVIRKKRKPYAKSIPQHIAENTLNREFTAEELKEAIVPTPHVNPVYCLLMIAYSFPTK